MIRSRITGLGAALPEKIVDNHQLAERVDTNDEWIVSRTGIRQRHVAGEGELTSHLATRAAKQAIAQAGIDPASIEVIILATETPDLTMPATAMYVQQQLGLTHQCPAYDIHAACSGFIYGLWQADMAIRAGGIRTALIIGAETFSRLVDWNDRNTCILFGDGAGAAIVQAEESSNNVGDELGGVLATRIYADGNLAELITTTGGVSLNQTTGVTQMNGREVFRHAVGKMCAALETVLEDCGYSIADIDLLVPHQANARIINAIGKQLDIPEEKVIVTVDRHANTSAASIPLALTAAQQSGQLVPGKLVALQALGAGLTWGACLIRW